MLRYLFILSVSVIFISCKKDGGFNSAIVGTWELESSHGFTGMSTYPPGNGNILKFNADGRFERIFTGSPTRTGRYSTGDKEDCHPRQSKKSVTFYPINGIGVFEGPLPETEYITIEPDKISLQTSNCLMDGGITKYRRI